MANSARLADTPLPSLNFFPVTCRDGSSLLRGRSRRVLSAEEVTKTCEVLLAEALRRRCRYWLLDGWVSPQAQPPELHEWLQEDYFPRVRAQLGHQPCIALLVEPDQWQALPCPEYETTGEWPSWAARVGWFKEEGPALAWLRQQGAQERDRHPLPSCSTASKKGREGEQLRFNF